MAGLHSFICSTSCGEDNAQFSSFLPLMLMYGHVITLISGSSLTHLLQEICAAWCFTLLLLPLMPSFIWESWEAIFCMHRSQITRIMSPSNVFFPASIYNCTIKHRKNWLWMLSSVTLKLSGYKTFREFRFPIVRISISVPNVTSLQDAIAMREDLVEQALPKSWHCPNWVSVH